VPEQQSDDVCCLQNFMASMDEEWFRLVHVAIEAAAGPALSQLPTLREAAVAGDTQQVEAGLSLMCDTLQHMQALLGRMGEKCDPQVGGCKCVACLCCMALLVNLTHGCCQCCPRSTTNVSGSPCQGGYRGSCASNASLPKM
jgi:hypothetical protein